MTDDEMNTIRTNIAAISTHNALRMHSLRSIESMEQLSTGKKLSVSNPNSSVHVQSSKNTAALRSLEIAARSINDAISLINSIDVTASNIQNSLIDMRTVAMSESDLLQNTYWGDKGKICDYFQQASEGIIDMVDGHSWNGQNFMIGGGENDHTTTTLNFSFNAGGSDTSDTIQIELKSFHPHSAIDRDGNFWGDPTAPNLPDLNKSAGTDTHVYGDAALYHGMQSRYFGLPNTGAPYKEGHLHGDNRDAIDHTIIQLDRAISGLTAERARLGSFLSRLGHMADNVTNEILNKRVRKSQIEDTDVASQIAEFSKREILKQTSIAMLTQINRKGSELLELLN